MYEDVINTLIPLSLSLLNPNENHLSSLSHQLFTIMLNFCIKSVHSILAFTTTKENNTGCINGTLVSDQQQSYGRRNIPFPSTVSGLSFITFSDHNIHNPTTNVVDSAAVKPPPPPPPTATIEEPYPVAKKDSGGIGFLDEVGGSVDGLMSCTESIGFESSDERRVDDDQVIMERITSELGQGFGDGVRRKWKRRRGEEVRNFPPPLSSLSRDGRPSFFLRPVRRDGRLELTKVKIDRMEVLHASRRDGRLRLDMVRDVVDGEEDEEEENIDVDNNHVIEEEKVEEGEIIGEEEIDDNVSEEVEEEERNFGKEEEERVREKWVFPAVVSGGGDGFRRCHEVGSHHNLHHNLHAWGQHCLTIR